jgi:hypothetical protein
LKTGDDGIWSKHLGLIVVFVGIQLCVCLWYAHVGLVEAWDKVRGVGDSSLPNSEGDSGSGFPMPSLHRFLSGDFQRAFETAARENFPGSRATLLPLYRDSYARLSHLSLILAGRPAGPEPLWGEYSLVGTGTGRRICGRPTLYRQEDRSKLADRASYYNRLSAAWPNVHFCVFPILSVADWYAMNLYGQQRYLTGDSYARGFRTLLRCTIGYAWAGEGSCPSGVIAQYYRTDHHLTFPGAYQAYRQLCQLLCRVPLEPKQWIELPNLAFYGSMSRRTAYFDGFGDPIVDGVFNLPRQKVRIYGFEGRERDAKRQYRTGKYPPGRFADHYGEYYGNNYGLVVYSSDTRDFGNLLVIGDSFDNCIEPLLAAHFSRCWFVDLRLYAKDVGEEFDMDKFLLRHGITDVLFLGSHLWVLGLSPIGSY